MRRRESPSGEKTGQGLAPRVGPVELRLHLPLETDASFASSAETPERRGSYPVSGFPLVRAFAGATIALLLGWTIYYDLIAHHPNEFAAPARVLPVPEIAVVTFPANGTVIADYQSSEIGGAGLRLQTPPNDLGRLFVVALEDWQTGARVAHAFLRANTIETLRLPPGRYRVVVASGHVWHGEEMLFGPETHVDETLGPMELKAEQTTPESVALFTDAKYPMTQVPTDLFVRLLSGRR